MRSKTSKSSPRSFAATKLRCCDISFVRVAVTTARPRIFCRRCSSRRTFDYDPSLPFSSWIYRIAHNETITHFRKEKNRPFVLDKGEDDELFGKIVDDLELSRHEIHQYVASDIQAALEKLEAKYCDIIILKFFEEKSYEEISDILQMPQGTIATLINRAKKKLKLYLEKNQ
jgi:RNA polymerase sigma-70 factor (ECF subfamily)